jgi:COPI associated protein
MSGLLTSENVQRAGAVAQSQWQEVQTSMQQGQWSLRLLALLAGIALVVTAGLGCLHLVLVFHWTQALMELYAFLLGVIVLILESTQLQLPGIYLQRLFQYALFLKFVWGRGCLYFVAGSLQFAQNGLVNLLVGAYVMAVGLLYIFVGRATAQRLQEMRNHLYSEEKLRQHFADCDETQKGTLSLAEFRNLTASLGMGIKPRETEAAFLHLNKADNGELSFEEFSSWWRDYDDSEGGWMQRMV